MGWFRTLIDSPAATGEACQHPRQTTADLSGADPDADPDAGYLLFRPAG